MTYPALLTRIQILQRGISPPRCDHLEPFGGQGIYKALLHKIAIHYYYTTVGLECCFVTGDHRGILIHYPLLLISGSSIHSGWLLCLGGFDVISHVVTHINERQHACFQPFLCPLMRAIPELVYAGSVFATLGHKSGIESKDAFFLLQRTVQSIKQFYKGQWLRKLLPDRSVRIASIAA